jgi:ketosteroid isomerase-like protein
MTLRNRTTLALLFTLVGLAPTTALAQIEENRIPLQTKLSELYRFREEYAAAYNKKDVAVLSAMYAPDAIVVTSNGAVSVGKDAVAKGMGAAASGWAHAVLTSDSMAVYGNTAVDQGTIRHHPQGSPEVVERYLVVLRRGMQDWKIVRVAVTPVKP